MACPTEQDLKDTQEEDDNEDASTTARRRPKRWAWSPSEAYFTDILIRTCIEVQECGRLMSIAGIQQVIMDIWHRRYFNVVLHPKPHLLQHPSEVWKHTAFTDQREYDEFLQQGSTLGKPTVSQPANGMKQQYHDFAEKIWNKFKLVRREIGSQTAVIFAKLCPGNKLPSGGMIALHFIFTSFTLLQASLCPKFAIRFEKNFLKGGRWSQPPRTARCCTPKL